MTPWTWCIKDTISRGIPGLPCMPFTLNPSGSPEYKTSKTLLPGIIQSRIAFLISKIVLLPENADHFLQK